MGLGGREEAMEWLPVDPPNSWFHVFFSFFQFFFSNMWCWSPWWLFSFFSWTWNFGHVRFRRAVGSFSLPEYVWGIFGFKVTVTGDWSWSFWHKWRAVVQKRLRLVSPNEFLGLLKFISSFFSISLGLSSKSKILVSTAEITATETMQVQVCMNNKSGSNTKGHESARREHDRLRLSLCSTGRRSAIKKEPVSQLPLYKVFLMWDWRGSSFHESQVFFGRLWFCLTPFAYHILHKAWVLYDFLSLKEPWLL